MLLWQFQLIRLVPLLAVFAYAAYRDYKTGEVPNKIWFYAPLGAALTLLEVYVFTPSLIWILILPIMAVLSVFSLGLFFICDHIQQLRKSEAVIFGGADSKALIVLALSMPLSPVFCFYVGLFPLVAFVLGAFLCGIHLLIKQKSLGLNSNVRFLPYLFLGILLALI